MITEGEKQTKKKKKLQQFDFLLRKNKKKCQRENFRFTKKEILGQQFKILNFDLLPARNLNLIFALFYKKTPSVSGGLLVYLHLS